MGTCFSYLKRNMKRKRRENRDYHLTPRSFYQHDKDTVELQYLVSSENSGDVEAVVHFNTDAVSGSMSDMNENISSHTKEYIPSKKRRILRRFISWLEEKDDTTVSLVPSTEGDMMLRMMISNSINKISSVQERHYEGATVQVDNSRCDDDKNNVSNNANKNSENMGSNSESIMCSSESYRNIISNNNNNNNNNGTYCVSKGAYCNSSSRSSHSGNVKSVSYCSLRVANSNSDSNSSSIDLEWEPEGNPTENTAGAANRSNRCNYQHQSSEDSVELSLISSAESLEWDACEGAGIVLDSDTEQLIQEIERLTARALKETGSDFNFNSENTANVGNSDSNINR